MSAKYSEEVAALVEMPNAPRYGNECWWETGTLIINTTPGRGPVPGFINIVLKVRDELPVRASLDPQSAEVLILHLQQALKSLGRKTI